MDQPFLTEPVVRIAGGTGSFDALAAHAGRLAPPPATVLVVGDAGMAALGLLARADALLSGAGYDVAVFDDIKGEPDGRAIDGAVALARHRHAALVVGIGGGSAIDVAKLAAGMAPGNGAAMDYALCATALPATPLAKIMIPTTAGTGAEMTRTAVFAGPDGRKLWAWGDELRPDLAILDPKLAVGLPTHLTAATGIDALVHAIEAVTAKRSNPMAQAHGLHAIRLVATHLDQAVRVPGDLTARGALAFAAALAGAAIDSAGTGIAHCIGHALGSIAKVHHGRAVGLCLRAALAWNAEAAPAAHAAVALALGVDRAGRSDAALAADAAPAYIALLDRVGLALSLKDHGLGEADTARLLAVSRDPENAPMRDNNARATTDADLERLCRAVLAA
jgi:alcohol dehydrogenase class IV